jgi:two-component system phosphate regulon response regulator PhoB
LQAAIKDALPALRVVVIGEQPPAERRPGHVWCFVDWLLPNASGLEMCRRLRESPATAHAHITMVLEEDDGEARRRALRAGADDYVLGPLTAAALATRLKPYRASSGTGNAPPRLQHGELSLDLAAHQLRWRGQVIALRPNEFRLLAHFIEHPDQVFSRTALIATLGKDDAAIDERTVDVWVGRLRRALKAHGVPDPLRTVRSLGYVLDGIEAADWRQAS